LGLGRYRADTCRAPSGRLSPPVKWAEPTKPLCSPFRHLHTDEDPQTNSILSSPHCHSHIPPILLPKFLEITYLADQPPNQNIHILPKAPSLMSNDLINMSNVAPPNFTQSNDTSSSPALFSNSTLPHGVNPRDPSTQQTTTETPESNPRKRGVPSVDGDQAQAADNPNDQQLTGEPRAKSLAKRLGTSNGLYFPKKK
jgi:hypothetical protein